ncbi:cytochrome b562 [Marinomonas algarum]|uniref:Cytochrome b562 n=1 Tax=Marinomonas algarum TaxID=2883105 RepID=A0A9X1LB34_9GAMM|nr:cytochrome b562 [Marinomonas algarum]MCB5160364.1 cytochrome b562 [Marinomonas algarum]
MFIKKGLLAATILSVSCSTALFAHEHHQDEMCGETKLHGYMMDIKNELRAMSSDIKSGDNSAAAERIDSLIASLEQSRNETPYQLKAEKLKGEALATQQKEYVRIIDGTIDVFKNLEQALLSGDSAGIKKWLGEMGSQRQQGHGAFKANC